MTVWRRQDACLLVVLNKRDLPEALPVDELTRALGFTERCEASGRKFFVQPAVATSGEGLRDGLTWLCDNMAPI